MLFLFSRTDYKKNVKYQTKYFTMLRNKIKHNSCPYLLFLYFNIFRFKYPAEFRLLAIEYIDILIFIFFHSRCGHTSLHENTKISSNNYPSIYIFSFVYSLWSHCSASLRKVGKSALKIVLIAKNIKYLRPQSY